MNLSLVFFFFSSRRRHTRLQGDWSSDVCSSDLFAAVEALGPDSTSPSAFTEPFPPLWVTERRVAEMGICVPFRIVRSEERRCRGRGEISVVAVSFKKKKTTTEVMASLMIAQLSG